MWRKLGLEKPLLVSLHIVLGLETTTNTAQTFITQTLSVLLCQKR
jgi:hypothetical protein